MELTIYASTEHTYVLLVPVGAGDAAGSYRDA